MMDGSHGVQTPEAFFASSEYQQLRTLLVAPEATALNALERELDALRRQIHDPDKLALILRAALTQVFLGKDPKLSDAVIKAITPLLDRALREKAEQDPAALAAALAPASTAAIALQYASAPDAAAQDLAPLVSAAIKEQIRDERDTMIDALYPVIGSTISKYISQTLTTLIQTINTRIETHLSLRTLTRRLRARAMGLSEAELLLRESMPWTVDAAFLIQKSSGLVITQAQNPGAPALDPDLLSGMLTAIRNLFNESLIEQQGTHELDQIEYGESRIMLEVAGFCYLAAVVRGVPDDAFRARLRETLAFIVELPGRAIEGFSGDQATVPAPVTDAVAQFVRETPASSSAIAGPAADDDRRRPAGFLAALAALLLLIALPIGIAVYRNSVDRASERRIASALLSASPSPLDRVKVEVDRGHVRLSGSTTNEHQRTHAQQIAAASLYAPGDAARGKAARGEATPGDAPASVENLIVPDPAPALPALTEARVRETVSTLNGIGGVMIDAWYHEGALSVMGASSDSATTAGILRTFDALPGVSSLDFNVHAGAPVITTRLYFGIGSAAIREGEAAKLGTVKELLGRLPAFTLEIIGHSDQIGGSSTRRRIATARATSVRAALVRLGVAESALRIQSSPGPPPGGTAAGSDSLSRCVRFELLPLTAQH